MQAFKFTIFVFKFMAYVVLVPQANRAASAAALESVGYNPDSATAVVSNVLSTTSSPWVGLNTLEYLMNTPSGAHGSLLDSNNVISFMTSILKASSDTISISSMQIVSTEFVEVDAIFGRGGPVHVLVMPEVQSQY